MAQSLKVVVGNTAPQYQITCERPDGTIINLTGCTVTFYLYLKKIQTNVGHETSTVSVLSPASAGVIGWQPAVGDFGVSGSTTAKGTYKGNVVVTYSDSSVETLYTQVTFNARNLIQ